MNKYILALIILLFTLYSCVTTSSKVTKEKPASRLDSTTSVSKKIEIPLEQQYQEKGKNSLSDDKYDEALEFFLKADSLKPDDDTLLFYIGLTLRHLDRDEEALTYFHRVLEKNPNDEKLLTDIGLTLRRLNRIEEALTYFHRALEENPNSSKSLRNTGLIHRELNQDPEAIGAFSRLLEIEPNDEVSIINLADLYFKIKEYEKCYKYISIFYENLGDRNFLNTSSNGFYKIKNIFKRFDVYVTIIDEEKRKKRNKVEKSF